MIGQGNAWDFKAGQLARQLSAHTMMPSAGKMRYGRFGNSLALRQSETLILRCI